MVWWIFKRKKDEEEKDSKEKAPSLEREDHKSKEEVESVRDKSHEDQLEDYEEDFEEEEEYYEEYDEDFEGEEYEGEYEYEDEYEGEDEYEDEYEDELEQLEQEKETEGESEGEKPKGFKERRREPRKILEPARLVKIEIPDGDSYKSFYVSVVDISRHGMKLISDIPIEPEQKIPIKFYLEREPEEITARIAWCKELMPRLFAVGLDLREMSKEQYEKIDQFLEKFAPYEERHAVRVKRPFLVEILSVVSPETGEEIPIDQLDESLPNKFFTYATEISTGGMRIINDFKLPEDKLIKFKIYLGKGDQDNETNENMKAVEVLAKVMWQQPKPFGVLIGLQFENVSQETVDAIKSFIFSS